MSEENIGDEIESLSGNIECLIRSYDVAVVSLLKIKEIQEKYNKTGEEFDIADKAIKRIYALREEFEED
jgi:hypothetical protein